MGNRGTEQRASPVRTPDSHTSPNSKVCMFWVALQRLQTKPRTNFFPHLGVAFSDDTFSVTNVSYSLALMPTQPLEEADSREVL